MDFELAMYTSSHTKDPDTREQCPPLTFINRKPKSINDFRSQKECRRKSESLEKYHETQDRKDKENDKYMEGYKDKDRQGQECRRMKNNC